MGEQVRTPPVVPYDKETETKIRNFYMLQKKKPGLYRIGDDTSLQTYTKENVLQSSIYLKNYREILPEERQEMEDERLEKLAALDVVYEVRKTALREAIRMYKQSGDIDPVVIANTEVQDIELQRVAIRSGMRGVKTVPIPLTKDILFEEPYETRKLFGDYNLFRIGGGKDRLRDGIYMLERRPFKASVFYGRYEEATGDTMTTVSAPIVGVNTTVLITGSPVRIFYEPDNFLSPLFPVDFIYKDTQYSSAYQAYEAERALEKGMPDLKAALLKTRSARTIRIQMTKVKGHVANPQGVWSGILTAMYDQHPELVEELKKTGKDMLVYASPDKGSGGVALGMKDRSILDPSKWQDTNVVGKILEMLRAKYRESDVPAAPAPVVAAESVITTEEQKEQKTGAIISQKRKPRIIGQGTA